MHKGTVPRFRIAHQLTEGSNDVVVGRKRMISVIHQNNDIFVCFFFGICSGVSCKVQKNWSHTSWQQSIEQAPLTLEAMRIFNVVLNISNVVMTPTKFPLLPSVVDANQQGAATSAGAIRHDVKLFIHIHLARRRKLRNLLEASTL